MDITEAYEILNSCCDKYYLNCCYEKNNLGNTEKDTVKKHKLHSDILNSIAANERDESKKKKFKEAAIEFEKLNLEECGKV